MSNDKKIQSCICFPNETTQQVSLTYNENPSSSETTPIEIVSTIVPQTNSQDHENIKKMNEIYNYLNTIEAKIPNFYLVINNNNILTGIIDSGNPIEINGMFEGIDNLETLIQKINTLIKEIKNSIITTTSSINPIIKSSSTSIYKNSVNTSQPCPTTDLDSGKETKIQFLEKCLLYNFNDNKIDIVKKVIDTLEVDEKKNIIENYHGKIIRLINDMYSFSLNIDIDKTPYNSAKAELLSLLKVPLELKEHIYVKDIDQYINNKEELIDFVNYDLRMKKTLLKIGNKVLYYVPLDKINSNNKSKYKSRYKIKTINGDNITLERVEPNPTDGIPTEITVSYDEFIKNMRILEKNIDNIAGEIDKENLNSLDSNNTLLFLNKNSMSGYLTDFHPYKLEGNNLLSLSNDNVRSSSLEKSITIDEGFEKGYVFFVTRIRTPLSGGKNYYKNQKFNKKTAKRKNRKFRKTRAIK